MNPVRLAIFASGRGSNAREIIQFFRNSEDIFVSLIITNRSKAGILELAKEENIPSLILKKEQFLNGEDFLVYLKTNKISHIVLAGFLLKIPEYLIKAYPDKIINIHPALLPKYGGKGMYGHHVHEAVLKNQEKESGITIHLVNENYDEGKIVFQASCSLDPDDKADDIAAKVLQLEHFHYPRVIKNWVNNNY
jgi:phosphoribosylglycinamide formyltransferase-1